jgi:ATP-dependent DNA helicase RecQ
LGVFRPDLDARLRISGKAPDLVSRLDALTEDAAFVLGHNVVAFDQPALARLYPGLALHRLPLVDTLELSPVAFPQNPYHRLVKDYKLCTTTRNDPVRDAELAYALFLDQSAALQARVAEHPDEALCLHFLLSPEPGKGVANFFASLRRAVRPSLEDVAAAWQRATAGKVCIDGAAHAPGRLAAGPHVAQAPGLCAGVAAGGGGQFGAAALGGGEFSAHPRGHCRPA